MSASFRLLADTPAATRRGETTAGRRAAPVTHLPDLPVTAPVPLSRDVTFRLGLPDPVQLFVAYTDAHPDVKEGDLLVLTDEDETTYTVRAVNRYPATRATARYTRLYLEEVRA